MQRLEAGVRRLSQCRASSMLTDQIKVMFFGRRSTGQIGVIFGQSRDGKFRRNTPCRCQRMAKADPAILRRRIRPQLRQHRRRVRAADIDLGKFVIANRL